MTILVSGGAGFIGSNFVLDWLATRDELVVNLDKLTYAGNPENIAEVMSHPAHVFVRGDINDRGLVDRLLQDYKPRAIVNLAAESHVDRSIHGPQDFIQANIVGTFNLLEAALVYWKKLAQGSTFRFVHVSTDEVYGALGPDDVPFSETTPYAPNSPYSASKAASDHLVRAYQHTYGLPTVTTNCSNNYGPYQFPEKLIPLMLYNAMLGKPLPIYGDGKHVRDWLYVGDHCRAIQRVLEAGQAGAVYNIGGWNEKSNLEVINTLCDLLDEMRPSPVRPYRSLMTHVRDRPGHDRRYAIDASKIERELGWKPAETFETGIRKTVRWYLDRGDWVDHVVNGSYRSWIDKNYGKRST